MSARRRRGGVVLDTMTLSGWLFADLMLGLAMLFFVFNTVGSEPPPLPTPTPTVTATATPSATSTPTSSPTAIPMPTMTGTPSPTPSPTAASGLKPSPEKIQLTGINAKVLLGPDGPAKTSEQDRIKQQIRDTFGKYDGVQRAGIVLTFGVDANSDTATRLAHAVNGLLKDALPGVFRQAVTEDFIRLRQNTGVVDVWVYYLLGLP